MNSTVYHALNQCSTTGLEVMVKSMTFPTGQLVRLYRDHVGRYRIVAFKTDAHLKGYSGILLMPDGEVYYKETCPSMRGFNTTRQLQACLTAWGIKWYRSQHLTEGGKACYK